MIDLLLNLFYSKNSSLLFVIITAFAGSYGKDYLRIMKSEQPAKISLTHVLLSTFTATLVIYGLSDTIIDKFGEKILTFASFVCGLVGFQLMEKMSTIDGLLDLYNKTKKRK